MTSTIIQTEELNKRFQEKQGSQRLDTRKLNLGSYLVWLVLMVLGRQPLYDYWQDF